MNRRRPSIEDIARAAGVANSTVSRALRDSPLISADVRSSIQRLAEEMGYTPNGIAQSLQTRQTNTIGLVVTSIGDPFFADVARGVEEGARGAGLSVFLSTSHSDPAQEMAVIETFQRRRVDGIIVADSQISSNHIQRLLRADVPTVLINSQSEQQTNLLHSVTADDYNGMRVATDYLIQLGHRKIGYIGVGNRPLSNRRRRAGYSDTLRAAGIEPNEALVAVAPAENTRNEDDAVAGQTLAATLIHRGATAIVCYNDMIATGVLLACRQRGVAVPEQVSVVGFDDIALAQYVTPPLTTVRQPQTELGRVAMQMLLDLLDNRPVEDHSIETTLIIRDSTGPLR